MKKETNTTASHHGEGYNSTETSIMAKTHSWPDLEGGFAVLN